MNDPRESLLENDAERRVEVAVPAQLSDITADDEKSGGKNIVVKSSLPTRMFGDGNKSINLVNECE